MFLVSIHIYLDLDSLEKIYFEKLYLHFFFKMKLSDYNLL